ncbi:MAG: T9SS type A sorting domain-containing protein [Flavobacteriales bacterium]|nr:T9SS type A sorting domain-containing protein [Flavobacteriales bacterium]
MRAQILSLALATSMAMRAQDGEHPFIQSFTLTELDGRIHVEWVMTGGSTCDGSQVERSTDGVSFEVVHRIEGLCGDPAFPVPFGWYDEAPPEMSIVHYRIAFSGLGRSSAKAVEFRQLIGSEMRVFPSPTMGACTVLLRVPLSALVDITISDPNGRIALRAVGLNGREHALDLQSLAAGVYTVLATADGQAYMGRVVKQ